MTSVERPVIPEEEESVSTWDKLTNKIKHLYRKNNGKEWMNKTLKSVKPKVEKVAEEFSENVLLMRPEAAKKQIAILMQFYDYMIDKIW